MLGPLMIWTDVAIYFLLTFYVLDCLFLGLVIMMQRSKQEGLGAAFGGGLMESAYGAQTSQVLVKATVWAAIFFFVLSIGLARLYSHRATITDEGSSLQQQLLKPVAPPAAKSTSVVLPPTTNAALPAPIPPVAPSPAPVPTANTKPVTPATTGNR